MHRLILDFILIAHIPFSQEMGTPRSSNAKKNLICGGGEFAKELVIERQHFGVKIPKIKVDLGSYLNNRNFNRV